MSLESSEMERVGFAGGSAAEESRRPGRRKASPELLSLLRGKARPGAAEAPGKSRSLEEPDHLGSPARGIIIGLGLSVPVWAGILYGLARLVRG
ncbi:hypothetical protein ACFQX4_04975 [Roseomonas sp. GCM10028921]